MTLPLGSRSGDMVGAVRVHGLRVQSAVSTRTEGALSGWGWNDKKRDCTDQVESCGQKPKGCSGLEIGFKEK